MDQEDVKIISQFSNALSMDKIDEAFRVFDEIIKNLDETGTRELFGGYASEVEDV